MPAEPVRRLAADATESRTARVGTFAVGRRRRAKGGGQSAVALAVTGELPIPAGRRAALRRKGSREAIGAQRMGTPIGINGKSWRRRHKRTTKRPSQHRDRKDLRQRA